MSIGWDALGKVCGEVANEVKRASDTHGSMQSAHEGYAVILEEVDELWDEVKKNANRHPERAALMRREAIQVAAMAIRFVLDVCDKEEKKTGAPILGPAFYNE